jgi:hypothetical protein
MLEQEAHTFGLRDNRLTPWDMGSPQQMQMRGCMLLPAKANLFNQAPSAGKPTARTRHHTSPLHASAMKDLGVNLYQDCYPKLRLYLQMVLPF